MNKILIVDNEERIRMLYAEEFEEEGYDVFTTSNYSGLMDIVKQHKPNLIIFDIRTGHINDLDLLQDIIKTYKNISIVLCSGYIGFPSNMRSWIADFYIAKSSDLSKLKLKIKMALVNGVEKQQERLSFKNDESVRALKEKTDSVLLERLSHVLCESSIS